MDEDGYVSFISRKDDVIISAGYRIGPVEIDEALAGHHAVADAGVIGVPDDERGKVPMALVVLVAGFNRSADLIETLMTHVRSDLAKYEYPREIEYVEGLPKTSSGMIRRSSLKDRADTVGQTNRLRSAAPCGDVGYAGVSNSISRPSSVRPRRSVPVQ